MTNESDADFELEGREDPPRLNDLLPDVVREIPAEKQDEFLRAIAAYRIQVEQVERYSGPIPHPSIVERFEDILPEAPIAS